MAKKVVNVLKLQIPAGGANPSPPVGPALGQVGVNIMDFCNAFNSATQESEKGMPLPCLLYTSPSPRDTIRSRMPSSA